MGGKKGGSRQEKRGEACPVFSPTGITDEEVSLERVKNGNFSTIEGVEYVNPRHHQKGDSIGGVVKEVKSFALHETNIIRGKVGYATA